MENEDRHAEPAEVIEQLSLYAGAVCEAGQAQQQENAVAQQIDACVREPPAYVIVEAAEKGKGKRKSLDDGQELFGHAQDVRLEDHGKFIDHDAQQHPGHHAQHVERIGPLAGHAVPAVKQQRQQNGRKKLCIAVFDLNEQTEQRENDQHSREVPQRRYHGISVAADEQENVKGKIAQEIDHEFLPDPAFAQQAVEPP